MLSLRPRWESEVIWKELQPVVASASLEVDPGMRMSSMVVLGETVTVTQIRPDDLRMRDTWIFQQTVGRMRYDQLVCEVSAPGGAVPDSVLPAVLTRGAREYRCRRLAMCGLVTPEVGERW